MYNYDVVFVFALLYLANGEKMSQLQHCRFQQWVVTRKYSVGVFVSKDTVINSTLLLQIHKISSQNVQNKLKSHLLEHRYTLSY